MRTCRYRFDIQDQKNMVISLSKVKYNDDTKMHRDILHTVKNHFAIYLPPSTL